MGEINYQDIESTAALSPSHQQEDQQAGEATKVPWKDPFNGGHDLEVYQSVNVWDFEQYQPPSRHDLELYYRTKNLTVESYGPHSSGFSQMDSVLPYSDLYDSIAVASRKPYSPKASLTPCLELVTQGESSSGEPASFPSQSTSNSSESYGLVTPYSYQGPDWSLMSPCPSLTNRSVMSSRNSSTRSIRSYEFEDERHTGRCPIPECGRVFRDLRAHMLTHENERPEKCPIKSCEYSQKGFARKYDKLRHTLTHFKGTLVCEFCPDVGTPFEKTFNRCDVFLRHLSSVHGYLHAAHMVRKKPLSFKRKDYPSKAYGKVAKCSLCSETFYLQAYGQHLQDCVYRYLLRSSDIQDEEIPVKADPEVPPNSPRNDSFTCPDQSNVPVQNPPSSEEATTSVSTETSSTKCTDFPAPTMERKSAAPNSTDKEDTINVQYGNNSGIEDIRAGQDAKSEHRNIEDEMEQLAASSRCLSLTSSKGVVSSGDETDWTEETGSPESQPDVVGLRPMLSPMKQQLVDDLMREFHQFFNNHLLPQSSEAGIRTCHGEEASGNTRGGTSQPASGTNSGYSSVSFMSRKRSLSGGSSPPNDDGDDSNKRRRPDPNSKGKQPASEVRFACPYYKRNPGRHQTFTSCRDPGFTMVARLKEHLYRRHLLPIQCNRCCSTFPNDPALRDHQRDPRGCQIREQIPLEGFNKDQERKLKSKKRSLVFQSEEEKWKIVYRILFPDDNEADMPCPYIEYQPSNTAETSNVARFQEFSRLELPRLVRRTLEVAIEREAQPLEDKLKDRFVDIVRECQSQLITMFQGAGVSLDAADIPPLLPAAAAAAAAATATTANSSSAPTLGPPLTSEATPAPAAGQSTATPAVNVPRFFAETPFSGFDSSLPLSLPEPIIPPHSSSSSSSSFTAPPNPTDTPASAHSTAQRSDSSSAAEKPRGSPDSGYSSVNMESMHYPYSNNGMSHGSGVSGLDLYPEPHPHPQLPFDPHRTSFDAFDDYVDLGGCYGVGDASAVGAGDTSMWAFLNDGSGLFGDGEGSAG